LTGREPANIGQTGAPLAANAPSAGGIVSLLLACLPYAMLVGMLPGAEDFPGEGGGEAQYSWGFQQFWAYIAWSLTVALLWLALWRASRRTSGWAGRMVPLLVPGAGAAMFIAIAASFAQPGPLLPLVPILLPPAIGLYALMLSLPAVFRVLPRPVVDRVGIGLIAALSLSFIPLWALDAASYPGRLERHRAELASNSVAEQAASEARERELREKFASLGPDSSLRDYIEARSWYLTGVDILAGERRVKTQQSDAIALLDQGKIHDVAELWQLDLQASPALCQAYGRALAVVFGRDDKFRGSAYLSLLERQYPNMQWLREAHCDLAAPLAEVDARLGFMLDSKDPSGAAPNDAAAYYSRWGVSREDVEVARATLDGFRGGG
jgi:hypothetical protein